MAFPFKRASSGGNFGGNCPKPFAHFICKSMTYKLYWIALRPPRVEAQLFSVGLFYLQKPRFLRGFCVFAQANASAKYRPKRPVWPASALSVIQKVSQPSPISLRITREKSSGYAWVTESGFPHCLLKQRCRQRCGATTEAVLPPFFTTPAKFNCRMMISAST